MGDSMAELTLSQWVADLKNVLRWLNRVDGTPERRHVLVGASFGGVASACLAAAEPDLVGGLVLLSPGFGLGTRLAALQTQAVEEEQEDSERRGGGVILPSCYVEGGISLGSSMVGELTSLDEGAMARSLRGMPVYIAHGEELHGGFCPFCVYDTWLVCGRPPAMLCRGRNPGFFLTASRATPSATACWTTRATASLAHSLRGAPPARPRRSSVGGGDDIWNGCQFEFIRQLTGVVAPFEESLLGQSLAMFDNTSTV